MKKQLAMFLVMMVVCGNAFAMSMFNKDLDNCLNKASQAAQKPAVPGSLSGGYDDKKLTQGYCECYKVHAPKNLGQIQYYCSQYPQ